MIFPKVTCELGEFLEWTNMSIWIILDADMSFSKGMASSKGYIWLPYPPSITTLLEEFLHIIGWKLRLPLRWHKLLHMIIP